ncbi:hypothetical protein LTR37_010403 [Vermiconidia calcicola]|uniref:Uncharacterized protein n=1 Tax=Vermiconidia calcicola TaxID=1690605 RepID=A0ACC3N5V6_9PEZI|nr:hypothetical protein LTR37_010403 [Vermiconidia calcicola]
MAHVGRRQSFSFFSRGTFEYVGVASVSADYTYTIADQAPLLRSPYPLSLDVREAPRNRSSQQAQATVLPPTPAENAQGARSSRNTPQITAPPHWPPSVMSRSVTPSSTGAVDGYGEEYAGGGTRPPTGRAAQPQAVVANRVRHADGAATTPERARTRATTSRQPTGPAAIRAQRLQQASNNPVVERDDSDSDES